MKDKLKTIAQAIKSGLSNLILFLKKNFLFCLVTILLETTFLISITSIALPFDNQCEQEITERITKVANESEFGLSINSVQMKMRGASDFYIYSDNDLRIFQTRNQHYDDVKSYAFAAYKPYSSYIPLSIKNDDNTTSTHCSVLMTESKYDGTGFYFDLPVLFGELPSRLQKNDIVILDSLAKNITSTNIEDLIGNTISAQTIYPSGSHEQKYVIKAILSSENNLGKVLSLTFGTNIVFCSEYDSFPMEGFCYFIGSKDKDENSQLVNFIYNKYQSSHNTSRYLEVGYSANYCFYEFSENNGLFLGTNNEVLIDLIVFYNGILPTIFCIVGVVLTVLVLVFLCLSYKWNKEKITMYSKGMVIFSSFIIASFSFLLFSLLYTFAPFATITTGKALISHSHTISSVTFLGWVGIALLVTLLSLSVKRKSE